MVVLQFNFEHRVRKSFLHDSLYADRFFFCHTCHHLLSIRSGVGFFDLHEVADPANHASYFRPIRLLDSGIQLSEAQRHQRKLLSLAIPDRAFLEGDSEFVTHGSLLENIRLDI